MLDYKDHLDLQPEAFSQLGAAEGGRSVSEPKQCMILHVAAALLHNRSGQVPTYVQVQALAADMRTGMMRQAAVAQASLGECPDEVGSSEADLRVFLHDLLHWGHDKDFRTLLACPPSHLAGYSVQVVKIDYQGKVTTEAVVGWEHDGNPKKVLWVMIHKGHMRTLISPTASSGAAHVSGTELLAAGWEAHLEAADHAEATVPRKVVEACMICKDDQTQPNTRRVGGNTGQFGRSVLQGLPPTASKGSPIQDKDWAPNHLVDEEDFKAWLGLQYETYVKSLKRGLDLVEFLTGIGRASDQVTAQGGLAIKIGLAYGHDLGQARDRFYLHLLIARAKPTDTWGAFPAPRSAAGYRSTQLKAAI
jgi:hypothetical protein